jgi:DNA invertase Pin-like site-specific DNA recombinase
MFQILQLLEPGFARKLLSQDQLVTGSCLRGLVEWRKENAMRATSQGNRPGHIRLQRIARLKIDRYGRSLKHLVNALADLSAYGVAFVSLRDNLDLSTPSGRLMFQIIGAMAEFERALIQERVRAGLRNARAKGRKLGRPRRIVDSSKVMALRTSGASWRAISQETGVGIATLYRLCEH